jgi:methylenetetrahydrofolate reductase (NADPH)
MAAAWLSSQVRAADAEGAGARRAATLIGAASIEIMPRDAPAIDSLRGLLRPYTRIFINHPPGVSHHDVVTACVRLRRAGFTPVPHVAARHLASYTQAADFLRRATGEADIDEVLLIGGDADTPVGPFDDSSGLLASGLLEQHGLRRVAFAGYPAGHPLIAAAVLDDCLHSKIAAARDAGLGVEIVTQFGFEPKPILRWIAALRRNGLPCPVRIGIAGPASVATLARMAVRCGVAASLRSWGHDRAAFARDLTEVAPSGLIKALVAGESRAAPVAGLHIFPFGGLRRTAEWVGAHCRPIPP